MKRIKIYTSLIVIFAFAISCEDGFLEREPLDIISEDVVYNDQGYVESVLYRLYNYMPIGFQEGKQITQERMQTVFRPF
ncbi:hypothetical protein [Zobellia laminariae]|uniref:hypothetical protein n=1 Tax=Zobellia laminariae TaxID=248906 RepID=UPI0026F46A9F|nr:hypothetical protein [Zobellia laminariae]WKX78216.1 hypothetical protein Q5W13_10110 [Zobellia laminariae]